MTARYWVLTSDELMASDPPWEQVGLHPVGPAALPPPNPGMQWWQFDDDNADPALNGKRIELHLSRDANGTASITERIVL